MRWRARWFWGLGLAMAATVHAEPANAPVTRPVTEAQIRTALGRFAHEPRVSRVVAEALRVARVDPGRARAAARRAKRRGWLPTLRVWGRHGRGRDLSEQQSATSERTDVSFDDQLTLSAGLTFELGQVVFNDAEVPLLREERSLRQERREIVEAVVGLYFERRRLQLEEVLLGSPDLARTVRIEEAEALLNLFTGGAFRRMMDPSPRGDRP